jgi:hypothetical protein
MEESHKHTNLYTEAAINIGTRPGPVALVASLM